MPFHDTPDFVLFYILLFSLTFYSALLEEGPSAWSSHCGFVKTELLYQTWYFAGRLGCLFYLYFLSRWGLISFWKTIPPLQKKEGGFGGSLGQA
ncbi:hypothetical protein SODALDRAFT_7875 [Sodiomyces alkalinus F11]|uniref:Uncharacterized protein n=1 Tax=Sodiomyces alkalinus (strain CBS 110278 / VKM F-3762 / F11) TaxID=1314773 RepID=A0A3N2Q5R9_SODAK|nr:hypothetical protein SODALDRAFT_7875 [Sodiomyces alkalinus F11]ROT42121.1 hypothetical protein SODALDRAFT_7875 [Sodiomyces alkalinus F11]